MTVANSKRQNYTNSNDLGNKALFFVAGGLVGTGLALLFAPKSGAELRKDIADVTKKGYDETLEYAHALKDQSVSMYNTLKEKTEHVYDIAAAKFSPDGAGNVLPGSIIENELNDGKTEMPKKQNSGRRQSNIV